MSRATRKGLSIPSCAIRVVTDTITPPPQKAQRHSKYTTSHNDVCCQPFWKNRIDFLGVVRWGRRERASLWDPSKREKHSFSSVKMQTAQLPFVSERSSQEEGSLCSLTGACLLRAAPAAVGSLGSQPMRTLVLKESVECWVNTEPLGGRELCKRTARLREIRPVSAEGTAQDRVGGGRHSGRAVFLYPQDFCLQFDIWFTFLCCLHFGNILWFSFFMRWAGNSLYPGKEVSWSQRSPRTIHRRWKQFISKGCPTDICDLSLRSQELPVPLSC